MAPASDRPLLAVEATAGANADRTAADPDRGREEEAYGSQFAEAFEVERVRVADEQRQGSVLGPPRFERARAGADDRRRLPLVDCSGPELPAAAAAAAGEMGAHEAWRVGRYGRLREGVQTRERMRQRDDDDEGGGSRGRESDGGLPR